MRDGEPRSIEALAAVWPSPPWEPLYPITGRLSRTLAPRDLPIIADGRTLRVAEKGSATSLVPAGLGAGMVLVGLSLLFWSWGRPEWPLAVGLIVVGAIAFGVGVWWNRICDVVVVDAESSMVTRTRSVGKRVVSSRSWKMSECSLSVHKVTLASGSSGWPWQGYCAIVRMGRDAVAELVAVSIHRDEEHVRRHAAALKVLTGGEELGEGPMLFAKR